MYKRTCVCVCVCVYNNIYIKLLPPHRPTATSTLATTNLTPITASLVSGGCLDNMES